MAKAGSLYSLIQRRRRERNEDHKARALVEYNKDHPSQRQYDTFEKLMNEKFDVADEYVGKAEELINEAWTERFHEEAKERAKQRKANKERERRAVKEQRGWFEKTRFWLRYG